MLTMRRHFFSCIRLKTCPPARYLIPTGASVQPRELRTRECAHKTGDQRVPPPQHPFRGQTSPFRERRPQRPFSHPAPRPNRSGSPRPSPRSPHSPSKHIGRSSTQRIGSSQLRSYPPSATRTRCKCQRQGEKVPLWEVHPGRFSLECHPPLW